MQCNFEIMFFFGQIITASLLRVDSNFCKAYCTNKRPHCMSGTYNLAQMNRNNLAQMNSNKLSKGYKKDIYVLTVIVTFMILGNLITMCLADNFDVI